MSAPNKVLTTFTGGEACPTCGQPAMRGYTHVCITQPATNFVSISPPHEHAFYFIGKEWEPDIPAGANGSWVYLLYCNCGALRRVHGGLDQIGGMTP